MIPVAVLLNCDKSSTPLLPVALYRCLLVAKTFEINRKVLRECFQPRPMPYFTILAKMIQILRKFSWDEITSIGGGCCSGGRANHLLIVTLAGRSNIPGKHTIPKLNVCKCEIHLHRKSACMNGRMRHLANQQQRSHL